jgi:hypothetical protein
MRSVDAYLNDRAEKLSGRDRLIAVHGNRFILFYVFSHIDLSKLHDSESKLTTVRKECEKLAGKCLDAITPQINKLFPDSYPGNIFKNQDRQVELLKEVET